MTIPVAPSFASFDVTSGTAKRSVHNVLLDAMFAKSRFLEVLGSGITVPGPYHEWVSLAAPATFITATAVGGTTLDGSSSATDIVVSAADAAKVMVGTILVNSTIATPIGTGNYKRNELLQVTGISSTTITVARDAGAFNGGTGSTAHTDTSVFRILYTPHQEGSAAADDPNTYSADALMGNYTAIHTLKMQLTGSQMARAMEVVDSEIERQWSRELIRLKNELVSMYLYGYNSSTAEGSDTVIRNSKGLADFIVDNVVTTNPLFDYSTTTLTPESLNALFKRIWDNGGDPSEDYKIVASGSSKQVIGSWEADKVRTTRDETTVGREVKYFVSDMGFEAEIIAEPMVQKNDLFIINPSKVTPFTFREFDEQEWGKGTSAPNGDDMWYKRSIGEMGLMVLDPGHAHAMIGSLTW